MRKSSVATALAFSLPLTALISHASGVSGLTGESEIFAMCTALTLSIFHLRESLCRVYTAAERKRGLMQALSSILYYKSRNSTSRELMSRAISECGDGWVSARLRRSLAMLRLGVPLTGAINSEFHDVIGDNPMFSGKGDFHDKVSRLMASTAQRGMEKASTALDSMQRNSTISMFVSTIVPSFLLFAYIGSTIITQAKVSLIWLSIALLVVIPFAYSMITSVLSRRLIESTI